MTGRADLEAYRRPGVYLDSDAPAVVELARAVTAGVAGEVDRAVRLYHAVRDGIVYTPYLDFRAQDTYRASAVLARGAGYCVGKAALLAAAARAAGLAARVGFADVRNHLCTPRLRALSSSPRTGPGGATWSTCAIAGHAPTCPWRRSLPPSSERTRP